MRVKINFITITITNLIAKKMSSTFKTIRIMTIHYNKHSSFQTKINNNCKEFKVHL
jgi:hypothetical protein